MALNEHAEHSATTKQPGTVWSLFRIPSPITWAAVTILLSSRYGWAWRWLLSGSPIICFIALSATRQKQQAMSYVQRWALVATINLAYALAVTSWILYIAFVALSWPIVFLACIFHFSFAAKQARRALRALLSQFHFIHDKVAFFNLPALEIDTEVAGLMVIRGITVSLSTLTIEAHGVEVGIKLTDDMELAIQTETVKIFLFRRIEVSDVYANLKGGIHEMTFGELEESTEDADGNPLMNFDTTLIRAATAKVDEMDKDKEKIKMTDHMTNGNKPKDSSAQKALETTKQLSPLDQDATDKYEKTIAEINATNSVVLAKQRLQRAKRKMDDLTLNDRRAAICSLLHDGSSIPHPPSRSIKVTTLQNLSSPTTKRFLHRLPFLLRLLLNPLSYFHPVKFTSITAAASGAWIKYMLSNQIFKDYADNDSDLRSIRDRMMSWLADANFTLQLDDITGFASVPMITDFNILCNLAIKNLIVYRTLPKHIDLIQVAQIGGADFNCSVPSFLLPHHEHLLPAKATDSDRKEKEDEIASAEITPQKLQAERELDQAEKDETNVKMTVHVLLPACFDQTLLDFVAALVKATKLIELDKDPSPMEKEIHGIKDFAKSLNEKTKISIKKVAVNSMANDRWIAKLVGKVTKLLETLHGDLGYSGDVPVSLKPYREAGKGELSKLLP